MSGTSALTYHDRTIWATTEGLQHWLCHLVSESESAEGRNEQWFAELVEHWAIQAQVRDLGATLEDGWTSQQVEILIELAKSARRTLRDERVIQIADGWLGLLSNDLPPDPPSAWWFLGADPEGWQRIERRTTS
jgi:hypothetical protein